MTTAPGPSLLNIVLLYLSLMGLGAIGGYGGFYWLFSERCAQLMTETQQTHALSRQEVQKKYEDALEGQRQCMSDTSVKKELSEMQGRLEAQATLAERHQGLLIKQEETLARLAEAQALQDVAANTIASLRDELRATKTDLSEVNQKLQHALSEANAVETELKDRLQIVDALLDTRNHDIEIMNTQIDECDELLPSFRDELSVVKNYLRTRNHQQCRME